MNIETLVDGLTAEQIVALMTRISERPNVVKVDTTRRLNRMKRNNLYFSSCPKPHQVESFETYNNHADCIREQVSIGEVE